MKPTSRDRSRLNPQVRAELEEHEARVQWVPLLAFDEDVDPDPTKTDGTRPYEVGPSLMDRDRRGHLIVEYSHEWHGALKFVVAACDEAGDMKTVEFMLDNGQMEHLVGSLQLWQAQTTVNVHGDARVPPFVPLD